MDNSFLISELTKQAESFHRVNDSLTIQMEQRESLPTIQISQLVWFIKVSDSLQQATISRL